MAVMLMLGLVALRITDPLGPPGKWHAAISWSGCVFGMSFIWPRPNLRSPWFWLLWILFISAHLAAMWLIFGVLFPRLVLGTMYVTVPAMGEAFFFGPAIFVLERKLRGGGDVERASAARRRAGHS